MGTISSGTLGETTMKILTYEDLSTLVDYQKEKIVKIESAWQDAELRAERAEARARELEAES